jgi:hypothetical protein
MAFKLDDQLLEELGLAALPPHDKQALLRQILETLEMRVGTTLASHMSDAQLDEFERLMPAEGDNQATIQQKEQQALKWLESNFPNYKQVVNDELEKLKSEISQSAPQILAASQQNTAQVAAPTSPYQPIAPASNQQFTSPAVPPVSGRPTATTTTSLYPQSESNTPGYLPPQPTFSSPPTQYPPQTQQQFTSPAVPPFSPTPPSDSEDQSPYPPQPYQ